MDRKVIRLADRGTEICAECILTLGYEELRDQDYSEIVLQSILYHHENYDGTGYPSNLCR